MFSIFKADPVKKLTKSYEAKLKEAMEAQRSGDIKGYAKLALDADNIHKEILAMQQNAK